MGRQTSAQIEDRSEEVKREGFHAPLYWQSAAPFKTLQHEVAKTRRETGSYMTAAPPSAKATAD